MRNRLAGNSGALAAGAISEGYGDCAGPVNRGPDDSRRRIGIGPGLAQAVVILLAFCFLVAAPAAAQTLRIAMLGDSLTAGFGLSPDQALPAKLEAALKAAGRDVSVANHGVSGDTSAGGLARLDWTLGDKPTLVIVALGANDALRGLDPDETEKNLDAMIARTKAAGAAVLLCGMKAPRNYGPEYVTKFDGLYERLAAKHGVALMPFLLEGVAMTPELNQPDGIHPNAKGVEAIVKQLAPAVVKALEGAKKPGG
ncbi:MAG TPA: arylesterase [Vineibacter sp.]|nr:arylesterase [Vineibacter sp.]